MEVFIIILIYVYWVDCVYINYCMIDCIISCINYCMIDCIIYCIMDIILYGNGVVIWW